MGEEQSLGPPRRPRIEEVTFDGDRLVAVRIEGEGLALPLREICGALGLDFDAQSEKLHDHEVLTLGLRMVRLRAGNRLQSALAILHTYIPYWLATILPNQVKASVRPKLVRYQKELVELLAAIYGPDLRVPVAGPPALDALYQRLADASQEIRLAREALLAMQQQVLGALESQEMRLTTIEGLLDEHVTTVDGQLAEIQQQIAQHTTITGPQQEEIKRGIQRIAHRYQMQTGREIYARLFSQFCLDLGTPRYDALPAGKYNEALRWIAAKTQEYLPDDPAAQTPQQRSLL